MTVPFWNRNRGGVAAASADVEVARAALRLAQQTLDARFRQAWTAREAAVASATVYAEQVLPRVEEAYRLYLARYREMAAAYPQVLLARRSVLDATAEYLDALEQAGAKPCSCSRCSPGRVGVSGRRSGHTPTLRPPAGPRRAQTHVRAHG